MWVTFIFLNNIWNFHGFSSEIDTANHCVKRCTSVSQFIFYMFMLTYLNILAETVTTDIAVGSLIMSPVLFAYDVFLSGRAIVETASLCLLTEEALVLSQGKSCWICGCQFGTENGCYPNFTISTYYLCFYRYFCQSFGTHTYVNMLFFSMIQFWIAKEIPTECQLESNHWYSAVELYVLGRGSKNTRMFKETAYGRVGNCIFIKGIHIPIKSILFIFPRVKVSATKRILFSVNLHHEKLKYSYTRNPCPVVKQKKKNAIAQAVRSCVICYGRSGTGVGFFYYFCFNLWSGT
jgi:hypothetical protein